MNSLSKILFSLGFLLLMLFKVSALHIYEHGDESKTHEECHLCDLAMENQVAELHFSPQVDFPENISLSIQNDITNNFSEAITDLAYQFGLFSRPPPSLS